jgi:hypothetical protein
MIALVAFAYLAMLYNHIFSEGLIIFIIGTIGFWYLTITRIRENYRLCMQGKFKVVTLDNKLHYPTYIIQLTFIKISGYLYSFGVKVTTVKKELFLNGLSVLLKDIVLIRYKRLMKLFSITTMKFFIFIVAMQR